MKYSRKTSLFRIIDGMAVSSVLFIVFFSGQQTVFASEKQADIEIIADGKRYNSIEEYREDRLRKGAGRPESLGLHKGVNIQDLVRNFKNLMTSPLDITRGARVLKTAVIEQMISRATERQSASSYDPFLESYGLISRIGFNTGISKVVDEFQHDIQGEFRSKQLLARDLESTLRKSFGNMDYQGPILIISHQKKLRIMTLESDDAGDDPHTFKVLDLTR